MDETKDKYSVSIVIPVFNNSEFTDKCISKIIENTSDEYKYEIIIVDDNSTDNTLEIITSWQSKINNLQYYKLNENLKFGYACNYGATKSKGDILAFLNNDTEPQKNWLNFAIDRLLSNKEIGIVGCKLLYPDNTIQHCGIDFFNDVNPEYKIWPMHRYLNSEPTDPKVNIVEEVPAVTGAALFIKKSLFNEVGKFDLSYKMYFEDTDLCFKVRNKGFKIFYEPKSIIIHHEGKSSPNQERIDELNANAAKIFFSKWQTEVNQIAFKKYVEKSYGNISVLSSEIYPKNLLGENVLERKDESIKEYLHFFSLIESTGKYYIHFGGAGDALLLLSTFYDENPNQIVISFANSVNSLVSFFKAFPKLKHIYIIPLPPTNLLHISLRKLLPMIKNTLGMGATPKTDYQEEWGEKLNIFNDYGIREENDWARDFCSKKIESFQVSVAPKGSNVGMVGSKKNMLTRSDWKNTINFFITKGISPIIIGTPDEELDYPIIDGCINKRSYSFEEQMKIIASSDLFIGADSWGKTFAALANVRTYVFKPQHGEDLKNWTDPSDYVFIKPWKKMKLIENSYDLKKDLEKTSTVFSFANLSVLIDGALKNSHSLSYVNAEIALVLSKSIKKISLGRKGECESSFFKNFRYKKLKPFLNSKIRPDITISHSYPPRENKPTEGKWIIIQPWEFGSIPKKWLNIFSQADEIWVPSKYVRDIYCNDGVQPEKVFVVANGVNTELFKKKDSRYNIKTSKKIKLLFVGGTVYRKGIDVLLKAYTETFTNKDDICLIIKDVGKTTIYEGRNFSEQIKQILSIQGVAEIEYIDSHLSDNDLVDLYNTCDFLVHPYRGEGFGLPVLEAMACGMIPIVTKGGATDDFCNSSNSIQINSIKLFLTENKIGELETVNTPWMLEPDYEDLKRILKLIYEQYETIKDKFTDVDKIISSQWNWNTILKGLHIKINQLSRLSIQEYQKEALGKNNMNINSELSDFENLIKEVNSHIENKELDLALEIINDNINSKNIISLSATEIIFLLNLAGNISLANNNLESAKKYFEKELNENPNSSGACFGLGQVFIASDELEGAKVMLEWAVKNDESNFQAAELLEKVNAALV